MGELNRLPISKSFMLSEFESPDTHEVMVDPRLIECAQKLRDLVGAELFITSGYRTPEHNREVNGSEHSFHMKGQAMDCWTPSATSLELALAAVQAGFRTVIIERSKAVVHCALGPAEQLVVPAEQLPEAQRSVVPSDFPVYAFEDVFPN